VFFYPLLSFITSFINRHLVHGIVAGSGYDNGMIIHLLINLLQ
jgi:hypothetical protein